MISYVELWEMTATLNLNKRNGLHPQAQFRLIREVEELRKARTQEHDSAVALMKKARLKIGEMRTVLKDVLHEWEHSGSLTRTTLGNIREALEE